MHVALDTDFLEISAEKKWPIVAIATLKRTEVGRALADHSAPHRLAMTRTAPVFLGMTVHNGGRHIRTSITSLLEQSYKEFTLVIIDDGSTDESWKIISEFACTDRRVQPYRNPTRKGAIYSWRRVFELSYQQGAEYFAWASDHDIWAPAWLERLIHEFEMDKDVVLAYPRTVRIDENGQPLDVPSPLFSTVGLNVRERINALRKSGVGYGNMIYGLFKAKTLAHAGIYRRVLLPDTVVLWEVSLYGTVCQVDAKLWFRRYIGLFSIRRQRKALFLKPPWYVFLPYWAVNATTLVIRGWVGLSKRVPGAFGLFLPMYLGLSYLFAFGLLELKRTIKGVGLASFPLPP